MTSSPGDDGAYAIGDTVEVTANFTEAVRVSLDADMRATRPSIVFFADDRSRKQVFQNDSHNGTAQLVFRYTVVEGFGAANGLSIPSNIDHLLHGLQSGFRSRISDAAGNGANLRHSAHRFPEHKIDVVRPKVKRAELDGRTLTITFTEALGAADSLANSAFTVKKTLQGSEQTVSLSGSAAPAISGDTLTLTLASELHPGSYTGLAVSYAVPATGTDNKLRDVPGNTANGFTGEMVAPPLPKLRSASVDGVTLTLAFSWVLDTTTAPAASAFTVSGTSAATSVTGVAFRNGDATRVELTLSRAPGRGESGVTVSYSPPSANPLQDRNGNRVAGFTGESVTVATNAAPVFPDATPTELSVAENTAAGELVGTVAATDRDGDSLIYRLDILSSHVFDIDSNGEITVRDAGALDHEAKDSYPSRYL